MEVLLLFCKKMLRSPTHIVGHGPTSAATATTTTPANASSSPHHHHHNNNNNINSHFHGNNRRNSNLNGAAVNGNATRSSSQNSNNSSATTATTTTTTTRSSLFDSCHRKIRLIGGGPVAFLGGLVAKARRKERDGDQSSTDTKLYLEESVLERKLPDADLKALVDLPAGLDYNEWLASHTLALFEHVNLVYGTISEFCTTSGCPDMTGPGNRTYLWFDEKGKKTRVAAPQYIDYVMTFTQKTVSDESIFPTKYANEFPSSFESIARKILRLQFHVIAHLYAAHFREIALLGLHTHLNLTFAHLTALHRRFNLIDEKETDVLRDLEIALRLTDDGNNTSSSASVSLSSTTTTTTASISTSTSNISSTTATLNNDTISIVSSGNFNDDAISSSSTITMMATIDGDASVQPICTQPEAMKSLNSDQSDIRGGAGGGGGSNGSGGVSVSGCGGLIGFGNSSGVNALGGYNCSSSNNSGLNSSHIGGIMNFNNNHHNNSTHHPSTLTSSSNLIQCNNSNTSSSSNSHTTTTA